MIKLEMRMIWSLLHQHPYIRNNCVARINQLYQDVHTNTMMTTALIKKNNSEQTDTHWGILSCLISKITKTICRNIPSALMPNPTQSNNNRQLMLKKTFVKMNSPIVFILLLNWYWVK